MNKDTESLVIQALAKTLKISDLGKVKTSDKLKDDLGLDSMSSLTFLMELEDLITGFSVDPDTLDGDSLATVSSITQYVEKQIHAN